MIKKSSIVYGFSLSITGFLIAALLNALIPITADVEITETHIDHEGVKQYVALTRRNFSDEELQKYELEGRKSIEASLGSLGLENMARESAARQLVPIVQAFGFKDKDITITFRKNEKNNTILRRLE